MQRHLTIELQFNSTKRNDKAVRKAAQKAARLLYATAILTYKRGPRPRIALFSDDFFHGHDELELKHPKMKKGK